MSDDTVKVIVRCRPFNAREKGLNCKGVVQIDSATDVSLLRPEDASEPPKRFTFDAAYGMDSTTKIIYEDIAFSLVQSVLEGYNGTIFAYGQTGCGKSFSMEGIADSVDHRGITPRAFEHIFQEVAVQENAKFLVRASYLEIYNENVRDLLSKDVDNSLELKEHPEKGVYVKDLSINVVHSAAEVQELMTKGTKARVVGATAMNATSSRSHSIFTIWLEAAQTGEDGQEHIRAGKLNLVDLAGSERQSKTHAEGDRLKEATKINLSLSALGNVISALVDGKAKHIPYRDSKLTRLLQDSLGGNTKTLMVAALSPADNNYDETLSTLRYANRAKNIKNKAKINEDPKDALLRQYQEEIENLKKMLAGQLSLDPTMLAALGMGGASAKPASAPAEPKSKALPAIASRKESQPGPSKADLDAMASRIRAEKDAELKAMEERLKSEFDANLQKLQDMYNEEKTTNEKLEEEFEKMTERYNQQQRDLHEKIVANKSMTTQEVLEDANVPLSQHLPGIEKIAQSDLQASSSISECDPTSMFQEGSTMSSEMATPTVLVETVGESISQISSEPEAAPQLAPTMQYTAEIVVGPKNILLQALVGDDSVPVRAALNDRNELVPKLSSLEKVIPIIGPTGDVAKVAQISKAQFITLNSNGDPILALDSPDGLVKASLTQNKKVVGAVDEDGIPELVQGAEVEFIEPKPIIPIAKAAEGSIKAVETVQVAADAAAPQVTSQQQMVEELRSKLKLLEQNVVAGGAEAKNTELKEALKRKRKKAEQKTVDRLREARTTGNDDAVFEEIYGSLQDELKAKDKKLVKLQNGLQAAQTEVRDLQAEFEQDREDMLETIRKQDQQLKLANQILDRVRTLVRPNCNYYNLEKIRMDAVWDDETSMWRLPKVISADLSLPSESPREHSGAQSGRAHSLTRTSLSKSQQMLSHSMQSTREVSSASSHDGDLDRSIGHINDVESMKARRADQLLNKYGQRENQIAEQLESRMARFDIKPATSSRSQQLLNGDGQGLERNRLRGIGPPEPGGVSLGSPRSKRTTQLAPVSKTPKW